MLNHLNLRSKLQAAVAIPLVIGVLLAIASLALAGQSATVLRIVGGAGLVLLIGAAVAASFPAVKSVAEDEAADDERSEHVAKSARELVEKRLPVLIQAAADGETSTFDDFEGAGDDHLGQVIHSLNDVQRVTAEVATHQHERIRDALGDLVVNLVRRNQSLLDRQLQHIDELESSEEDPDRLEGLFAIDHLSTRMRRNAESLLVLAGSEPPRRKGSVISIDDLMRVAMGEIEGYQKVRMTKVDPAEVGPQAAFDIAHLLSELLENATNFSPPEAQVEMAGISQSDGYLLSIADHGIGMSEEQLERTNELLRNPPELNLDLGHSLGFIVVARLGQRLGVTIELVQTPGGAGVTALILLPESLLGADEQLDDEPAADAAADADTDEPEQSARPATTPAMPLAVDFDIPELDDEPAWQPPAVPDRGAGDLLGAKREGAEEVAEPAQSDALARLLGVDPTLPETEEADGKVPAGALAFVEPDSNPLPTREIGASGAANTGLPMPTLADGDTDADADATADDGSVAEPAEAEAEAEVAPVEADSETSSDEEPEWTPPPVTPDAEQSETYRETVSRSAEIEPGPAASGLGTTSKGLTRRNRAQSQAPASEGRTPGDGSTAATATSRDPAEIRNMLARYRKARGGKSPSESTSESGEEA